ncbi:hypothetical protein [Natronorubrum sp. DTA7]|uniref:hypothetical protein n=1 Tax=Natronorubrum sp. DTA7 TaxID=3447016 RepID=UPI003F82875F
MTNEITTGAVPGTELNLRPETRDTDHADVYLNGTLVLVAGGPDRRDPEDEIDLHIAEYGPGEQIRGHDGPTGPAWRAEDYYTSTEFAACREFAEIVTQWSRGYDATPWAVLSAENGVVRNWEPVQPYGMTIDDIGDDPTNVDHHVENRLLRRRPDGQEIITEMDKWAAKVATMLCAWISAYRPQGAQRWENDAGELLVLGDPAYVDSLRERGVFEYGIARMTGNPNEGVKFPLSVRTPFDEDTDRIEWLSDAIGRLEPAANSEPETDQPELGSWTGEERTCEDCGIGASDRDLAEFGGDVYCEDCEPIGRCNRCDTWTHETGLGRYPLCPDCQTQYGGQKREPLEDGFGGEQSTLPDGGEQR